jgi:hypothetical protein
MARCLWTLIAALLAFAVPAHAGELTFPAGVDVVRLPARIVNDHIIVRIVVAGRGLDVLLDTGSSGIVLDERVAAQLDLQGRLGFAHALGGPVDLQLVQLPEAHIGALQLSNVTALAAPFGFDSDAHTRTVGLLGYDFVAQCVLRIDYAHGIIDAIKPDSFKPAAGAPTLALRLENNIPLVNMSLNGVEGDRFVLDTGADVLTVFPRFAALHPQAVKTAPGAASARDEPDVGHAIGIGGEAEQYSVLLAETQFAGERFTRVRSIVVRWMPLRVDGGELDGLVGNALLRHFVVYVDYPHGRVLLERAVR